MAWEHNFKAYKDYKKEFGKEPTQKAAYNGINLGGWCKRQRRAYKDNKLSNDKIQKLRDAGFPFDPKEKTTHQ